MQRYNIQHRTPRASTSESSDTLDIAAIYREITKGPFIGHPKSYLALTGDNHKAALVLHHILYMCMHNRKLEYFREQLELGASVGLSKKEIQRALKVLKDRDLLTTESHLVKRKKTTFYYPSWPTIRAWIFEYWEGTPDNVQMDKRALPKKHTKEDKKEVRERDKTALPLKRTKGQLLNSSSEVMSSHRPSLIKKYANMNGSTTNEG